MPIRTHKNHPQNNHATIAGFCLLFLSVIVSCNQTPFLAKKSFDQNCWAIGDTIHFEMEHAGAETTAELGVEVKFIPEYSYRNLYLRLLCETPDGQSLTFMLNDTLMDAEGNWLGEFNRWTFSQDFKVPLSAPGSYRFSLIQFMREESLCDIKQAGIFLRE
ncbi:MAG: gliding motility lipoprotein GldH [Bacteroidia bacterium]